MRATNTYNADMMYLVKNAHLETVEVQFFEKIVHVSKILTPSTSERRHFLLVEKKSSSREAIKDLQRLSVLSVDPSTHLAR